VETLVARAVAAGRRSATIRFVFEVLSEKLQATLAEVRARGTLSEADIDVAMREIRLALLDADVNLAVVRKFTQEVKTRAIGAGVLESLKPGQQVTKIVNDELAALMGGEGQELALEPSGLNVILMAGLQGSGKTTASAKLAAHLGKAGRNVALAACDVYRPAAVEQLKTLGERAQATVYEQGTDRDPVEIAAWAREQAEVAGKDVLVVDTAGRLHVDDEMMAELSRIRERVSPCQTLLVVDAMTGQDAVNVAESFAAAAELDGIVVSKLDGDARGGAALSVKSVTGRPILFASTGEKLDQFERFHPDRMAGRILGMGDVLSLVEKVEETTDAERVADLERKLRKAQFGFDDFLAQIKQLRKMGPLTSVLGMLPGMGGAMKQLQSVNFDEREIDRIEAIILSMTPEERAFPERIDGSRRKRIAAGSGTTIQHVNRLVKQFSQMQKMMKMLSSGKMPDPQQLLRGL
jgi:signal recognition particle subunit SRP54